MTGIYKYMNKVKWFLRECAKAVGIGAGVLVGIALTVATVVSWSHWFFRLVDWAWRVAGRWP